MGRPLFTGFLTYHHPSGPGGPERGVQWHDTFVSWQDLLRRGRERAALVRPGRAYLVDPGVGHEGLVSFFAVATIEDTLLVWAGAGDTGTSPRQLAPGLYQLDVSLPRSLGRPLWGITTSGSSGRPKVPVGFADLLESVAVQYDATVFRPAFDDDEPIAAYATCLPLQFSAAFFMTVLPAMFFRKDLIVFPPYDWRPLAERARRERVVCMSVPSLTAAGCLSVGPGSDLRRAAVFMGGGYVVKSRVHTIREHFGDVALRNVYGTAETGAVAVDPDPGSNHHVGRPLPGKAVWLVGTDPQGVGTVATTGPDCCAFGWDGGPLLDPVGSVVTGTDYGHFDEAKHLYLDGRVDGGEKLHGVTIYTRRIERHLLGLEGVVDARVLVRRDGDRPEQLLARVVGPSDEARVREHCSALPMVERPALIECVPEGDMLKAYSPRGKL